MDELTLPEGPRIARDESGAYRWVATVDMRHNPTIAILVAKIVGIIVVALAAIVAGALLWAGTDAGTIAMTLGIVAASCVGVAVVAALSYAIYAAVLGWSYSTENLMDETGVLCRPAPREGEVARNVALGTAVVSALAGDYGVSVASLAATNSDAASTFASVRKVKGIRRHGVIKVSQPLLYNQVYVAPEDYDFVWRFITSRCPKARCVEA